MSPCYTALCSKASSPVQRQLLQRQSLENKVRPGLTMMAVHRGSPLCTWQRICCGAIPVANCAPCRLQKGAVAFRHADLIGTCSCKFHRFALPTLPSSQTLTSLHLFTATCCISLCIKAHQVSPLAPRPPRTTSADLSQKGVVTAAEVPAEPAKPPLLARLPLEAGALEALTSKVKQFIAAEEQRLLAAASMSPTKPSPEHDKLAQRWQVCFHSQ